MPTLFTTLCTNYKPTASEFVAFWSRQYGYKNMHLYYDNITLLHHSYNTLYQLFQWKNGMVLSEKKLRTFEKIAAELDTINRFRLHGVETNEFEGKFGGLTAIWKIFLLHIMEPEQTESLSPLRSSSRKTESVCRSQAAHLQNLVNFSAGVFIGDLLHETRYRMAEHASLH